MDVWQIIKDNWAVVEQAPLAFVMFLLVGAAVGFAAGKMFYAERLALRQEQNDVLKDKIQELVGQVGATVTHQAPPSTVTEPTESTDRIRQFHMEVGRVEGVDYRRHNGTVLIDRLYANEHFNTEQMFWLGESLLFMESSEASDTTVLSRRAFSRVTCRIYL